MNCVDVVILGAGPAACACAIKLAQAGVGAVILHRSTSNRLELGETLPGETRSLLRTLGLWERFERDGHVTIPGTCSAWASDRPVDVEGISNANGGGWRLDAGRLGQMV